MTSKQKVFVTGASSLLLREVIGLIDLEKTDVVGLTRTDNTALPEGVVRCIGDILEPSTYRDQVVSADIILHGAALTHSQNEDSYFKINVDGTQELLSQIPETRNPLFVLISSRVAGEKSGAYGISKLKAESCVMKRGKKWLILRPSEVFGGSKNEGIDGTIVSALKGGLVPCPLGVPSKMYPIHVKDLGRAIFKVVFVEPAYGRVKYINGQKGFSYKELLGTISSVSGNRIFQVPIHRLILKLAALVSSNLNIPVGFVPDQVDRLYSKKHQDTDVEYQTISLEIYLIGLVAH
jgi:nucleoside-diphosphate-sugar epimerase